MAILEEPIKDVGLVKNYINGEWVESESDKVFNIVNPALMKTIGKVPMSTNEEVDRAIKAAVDAFPDWRKTPPLARARYLFRLKELLEENFERLSRIQTMEHGKTIDESRGETRRGTEMVEVATGITSLMMGENLEDIAAGIDEYVIRQPLGAFACIPAFNFPFMIPLWFMPFAVACGNTYLIKPSPFDPISQVELVKLCEEAGFPPGVINMVHGGEEVANRLLEHPDIKGINFVGSTAVGKIIYSKCGETGKRCGAQCGAKNFMIVMPDCDLKSTITGLMNSIYGNAGQRCLAGANVLVVGQDDGYYEKFRDLFVDTASKIRVGYGLDESVQMGPLQAPQRKQRVLGAIERGVAEGAKLLLDGRNVKTVGDLPQTCFLNPSVFDDVEADMEIAREEIFGPVGMLMRAKNFDEAIEMINASRYGNASSIFTSSGKYAREFQYRCECGNIGVNIGIAAPMAFFPFGGMKESFFGTLHAQKDTIDFFTDKKIVIQRWI
jgi:malonate-semialdehyde dehydrogenase (acetylating)/methylmalonate-semialdehyde dehydrogenase